ncbi:MAG: glycolate oxidase subunit GlcF [Alphaproteobacteria bacterium]|nr:glycolate oxidase subunit GlcF [Alphaproteobacteria bacterium]
MQTHFDPTRLAAEPDLKIAEAILRSCVHCGFCLPACPTYNLLGDERDSPRGRIYLIKDMLESGRPAEDAVSHHLDRCLSCLSCATACPSGVDYMHLIDGARLRVEQTHRRPAPDRIVRALLGWLLPRPALFRMALLVAQPFVPLARLIPGRIGGMARLATAPAPPTTLDRPQVIPAKGRRMKRVALLTGCVQRVISPEINEATVQLLTRHGCEVVIVKDLGCCGALPHHLGQEEAALTHARRNVRVLVAEQRARGLDAVIANASGCGTTLKDYGFLLRHDSALAADAAIIAGLARDVSETLVDLALQPRIDVGGLLVAYHAACSLQHGQKITEAPKRLLESVGFRVEDVPDGHLCCGSAGTYNLLQPKLSAQLRDRKVANIERTGAVAVATGNIGCIVQISAGTGLPVLHTVELLDWATGGPRPTALGHGTG